MRTGACALIAFLLSGAATVTVWPADGATVVDAPAQVVVSIPDGGVREAHISVTSAAGAIVSTGPSQIHQHELIVPVSIASRGTYLVAYHLVGNDGQVLAGVTRFGVGEAPEQGHQMGHAHSNDPINIALTGVAGASVLVMLFVMFRRPRVKE